MFRREDYDIEKMIRDAECELVEGLDYKDGYSSFALDVDGFRIWYQCSVIIETHEEGDDYWSPSCAVVDYVSIGNIEEAEFETLDGSDREPGEEIYEFCGEVINGIDLSVCEEMIAD